MSEPALSVAFFDPAHGLSGSVREGVALLFDGARPEVLPEGAELTAAGGEGGVRAAVPGRVDLTLSPVAPAADLGGVTARVCRVEGEVEGRRVRCLGTATETYEPPVWSELDALRALSAVFDERHAVLALARRPRGAPGHGRERVTGALIDDGELMAVEEPRLSTVYDAQGRQRDASLELWLAEEDLPRRASGTAVAGASLALPGLRVQAAVFSWRMDGREGSGAYELLVRDDEPPTAA